MSEAKATPERAPRPLGTLRLALRWTASALALGFLCAGLFAFALPLVLPLTIWLTSHLASSAPSQAALATAALGVSQALICMLVLAVLSRMRAVARSVAVAAGVVAAALPALVLLAAQGPDALLPARVLCVRITNLIVCGVASGLVIRKAQIR